MKTLEIAYKEGSTHIEAILTNGKSQYMGTTKEEYLKDGCKIYNNWDEVLKLIEDTENRTLLTEWKQISEERYNDMLNCLPPKNRVSGAFMMCEYYTSNITSFYLIVDNKYFTAQRRDTVKYTECASEIRKQFNI